MSKLRAARIWTGEPVPEWNVPISDLHAQVVGANNAAADFPDTLELSGVPDELRSKVIPIPEAFPDSFLEEQMFHLSELWCPPREYRLRVNQRDLKSNGWGRFLDAFERLMGYRLVEGVYLDWDGAVLDDFIDIHVRAMTTHEGMGWGVHSMDFEGHWHDGKNFLAWHREYLAKFEAALMAVNPLVTIPYWDFVNDPEVPEPLSNALEMWNRFHVWVDLDTYSEPQNRPTAQTVNQALEKTTFLDFQKSIEGDGPARNHNLIHNTLGGTMATAGPSAHPLFWLLHAFIDKLWMEWQAGHPFGANPPNVNETLRPPPIITRTVAGVVSTRNLGYVYA
jgi:hypothetical protein